MLWKVIVFTGTTSDNKRTMWKKDYTRFHFLIAVLTTVKNLKSVVVFNALKFEELGLYF